MLKTYSSSVKKTLFLCFVFVLAFGLVSSFSGDTFGFGALCGLPFGLMVLFFGFGQRIVVQEGEIQQYSHLLGLLLRKPKKTLQLSEIIKVKLGRPKINTGNAFAAINIVTPDKEISFNPDLFTGKTLQGLFRELQSKNPSISFDRYAVSMIEKGRSGVIFTKTVFRNFLPKIFK